MTVSLNRALETLKRGDSLTLIRVPDGFDGLAVADLTRALGAAAEGPAALVHVARDGQRRQVLENALRFLAPEIEVLAFPAWDCQPYDRVSPAPGNAVNMNALAEWLESNGFVRAGTVRETGEYAVRGGILDLYAPSLVA